MKRAGERGAQPVLRSTLLRGGAGAANLSSWTECGVWLLNKRKANVPDSGVLSLSLSLSWGSCPCGTF